jgi:predicted dehydrogenase
VGYDVQMGEMVKFGIVGCGSIADVAHLPSISALPSAELVAVCDPDNDRLRRAAEKWQARACYTDYDALLDRSAELDALIIATPNALHREQAVAAADRGLHLLVEKPLAVTNTEAWDIVSACERAGVKLMVGCDRRFWPQNQWAKELIDADVIGTPLMIRASLHEHWKYYQGTLAKTDFRLRPEAAGGAAVHDIGAHAIDLAVWLMGRDPCRVVGIASRLATDAAYSLCDDTATILMEHDGGATTTISCNRFSPVVTQSTEVYGAAGTIFTSTDSANPFQSTPMAVYTERPYTPESLPDLLREYRWPQAFWAEDLIGSHVPPRWVSITPPRSPSNYLRMLESFTDCIINDRQPPVSGHDGARAVEVMCAVHLSMRTGGWVDLPLRSEVRPPHY